jgi:hypothetical protein
MSRACCLTICVLADSLASGSSSGYSERLRQNDMASDVGDKFTVGQNSWRSLLSMYEPANGMFNSKLYYCELTFTQYVTSLGTRQQPRMKMRNESSNNFARRPTDVGFENWCEKRKAKVGLSELSSVGRKNLLTSNG